MQDLRVKVPGRANPLRVLYCRRKHLWDVWLIRAMEVVMKVDELKKLDTDGLLELRDRIDELLSHRRRQLEVQLQRITGKPHGNTATAADSQGSTQPKFRIVPRYRSKRDPN